MQDDDANDQFGKWAPVMKRIIAAKEERRRCLRNLPYHEKVAIMIRMQRMIVPIVKDRDPRARIWELPDMEEETGLRK